MTFRTGIDTETAEGVVSAARTSLGDELRSVAYFTPAEFDVLYVRRDLYDSTDAAREAKSRLVDIEQAGFGEAKTRSAIATSHDRASIGDYEFTVRFHEDGFVVRAFAGDAGVLLTADSMDVNAFEDAVTAIRGLLAA